MTAKLHRVDSEPRKIGDLHAVGCLAAWAIISHGWGSTARTEALLTYMTPVILAAKFAVEGGA